MELYSLDVDFVFCCLECRPVVVVVFHLWLGLKVGQNLHHLEEVMVIVEVINSIMYYGIVNDVVVVYLSVGQSGFHYQYLFCAGNPERMDAVMV